MLEIISMSSLKLTASFHSDKMVVISIRQQKTFPPSPAELLHQRGLLNF